MPRKICDYRYLYCLNGGGVSYLGKKKLVTRTSFFKNGVADGTRTHDNQNHNLALYQLNYGHHKFLIFNV